jgi:hypothetical protein
MRKHLVSAPGIAVRRGQSAVLIPNERLLRVARTDCADAGVRSCSEHASERQTNWENLEPLEFMQRLAAPVPRARLHLIRFHGVLAPNAKLRSEIIPSLVEQATEPHAITRKRRRSESIYSRQPESENHLPTQSRRRHSLCIRGCGAIWNTSRATDHYAAQASRSNIGTSSTRKINVIITLLLHDQTDKLTTRRAVI